MSNFKQQLQQSFSTMNKLFVECLTHFRLIRLKATPSGEQLDSLKHYSLLFALSILNCMACSLGSSSFLMCCGSWAPFFLALTEFFFERATGQFTKNSSLDLSIPYFVAIFTACYLPVYTSIGPLSIAFGLLTALGFYSQHLTQVFIDMLKSSINQHRSVVRQLTTLSTHPTNTQASSDVLQFMHRSGAWLINSFSNPINITLRLFRDTLIAICPFIRRLKPFVENSKVTPLIANIPYTPLRAVLMLALKAHIFNQRYRSSETEDPRPTIRT